MEISKNELIDEILNFMIIIYSCYCKTTYVEDRNIYAQDLASAMSWIVDLNKGIDNMMVVKKILSSDTEKHFGDYWRQGEWGNKEADALQNLKDKCKCLEE